MASGIFDLVVIGAGSGGVRLARTAAGLGARVLVAESRFLGGTCVNVGCVPKKLFAYASEVPGFCQQAGDFGFSAQWSFDWQRLRDNKTREIERLNGVYQRLLETAGVTLVNGHAVLSAPGEVRVGDHHYHARHVVVATGSRPWLPDIPGIDLVRVSDELFYLERLPRRAVVVGGGYIACEFASILYGLGVEVTQVYRGAQLLREFDGDISEFVTRQMSAAGVGMCLNTTIEAIHRHDEGLVAVCRDGRRLDTDEIFYATGRVPDTEGLFELADKPAITQRGALVVDEHFATSIPNTYAIGDVIDRFQLTPVALAEGTWLAHYLFADSSQAAATPVCYDNIPTAVFCHPNVATVGLTQSQALKKHGRIRIYRSEFRPMRYSLGESSERSLMKVIVDDQTDRVLGIHMAGEGAGEIMQGFAVAVRMGATKAQLDATIGIHPTSAEELVTLREFELLSDSDLRETS